MPEEILNGENANDVKQEKKEAPAKKNEKAPAAPKSESKKAAPKSEGKAAPKDKVKKSQGCKYCGGVNETDGDFCSEDCEVMYKDTMKQLHRDGE